MTDSAQLAFQEYMLRGKGKTLANKPSSSPATPSTPRTPRTGPVAKTFQSRLQDWKSTDASLQAIVDSMAHLRDRLAWASKPSRVRRGAFARPRSYLTDDDVQLALSHDVLQHERLLAGLRSSMASLAQLQEALGRRLEEWMGLEESSAVEMAEQVYGFLAREVYRKQVLVQRLLSSCHDGLLMEQEETVSPRIIARKCSDEWPSSRQKEWPIVDELLKMRL